MIQLKAPVEAVYQSAVEHRNYTTLPIIQFVICCIICQKLLFVHHQRYTLVLPVQWSTKL